VARKRNPLKQIMSDIHRESRAGEVDLSGHGGFIAEVKRRARAAGLPDEEVHELVSRREHGAGGGHEESADD
jgi:hypothetical protein